jgi:undecaprenyl-diphosphatase
VERIRVSIASRFEQWDPVGRNRAWQRWPLTRLAAWGALLTRPPRPASAARPPWRAARRIAVAATLVVALLVLVMAFLDMWVLTEARRLSPAAIARFQEVTRFGLSGWFLWPLGLLLLALMLLPAERLRPVSRVLYSAVVVRVSFLFLAIALPGLFVTTAKRLIGRGRPFVGGEAANGFNYHPFAWSSEYASFPSGHATTAFSVLVAFGALWPSLRPVLWIYALLIALSRVMVAAHHPSDVIAGAVIGTIGALLVREWFAERRLAFFVGSDGRVHPLPGPFIWRIGRLIRALAAGARSDVTAR